VTTGKDEGGWISNDDDDGLQQASWSFFEEGGDVDEDGDEEKGGMFYEYRRPGSDPRSGYPTGGPVKKVWVPVLEDPGDTIKRQAEKDGLCGWEAEEDGQPRRGKSITSIRWMVSGRRCEVVCDGDEKDHEKDGDDEDEKDGDDEDEKDGDGDEDQGAARSKPSEQDLKDLHTLRRAGLITQEGFDETLKSWNSAKFPHDAQQRETDSAAEMDSAAEKDGDGDEDDEV